MAANAEKGEEDVLDVIDSLSEDHFFIIIKSLRAGSKKTPTGIKKGGMTPNAFKTVLSKTLGIDGKDQRLTLLSKKIKMHLIVVAPYRQVDSNADRFITEEKFVNYILHYHRERDSLRNNTSIPFLDLPTFKCNIFSTESHCRIIPSTEPQNLFTVSKDGLITTWSPSLQVKKGVAVNSRASVVSRGQLCWVKRMKLWITDAALMSEANMLVVSTTSRKLIFYDVSSVIYKCHSKIRDLPKVALCLTSYTKPSGSCYVIYGDEDGNVVILLFHDPQKSLFRPNITFSSEVNTIPYSKLADHSQFVTVTVLPQLHSDWVNYVMFLPHNDSIISCSSMPEDSLIIRQIANKTKQYVFKLSKGISCFDFSHKPKLLVTGSSDHIVRFWDPHVTSCPIAVLNYHWSPILDVLIHKKLRMVLSFSQDQVLCAWDIKEHTLIQSITVTFPFHGPQPSYGLKPLFLLTPSILTVSCNNHIVEYHLGTLSSFTTKWSVLSHAQPLTAAVYDSRYDQVVSGSEGGEICVWDISTGTKVLRIKEAHGNKEITCLIMDNLSKRVITGSSNGEIKVWNHVNGECVKLMRCPGNLEVTGLVHLKDSGKFLAAGWSKIISSFPDDDDMAVLCVKPDKGWDGTTQHTDEITAMAFCLPNYLATGSVDGDIIVWNTDTELDVTVMKSCKIDVSSLKLKKLRRSSSLASNPTEAWSESSQSLMSTLSTQRIASAESSLQHAPIDELLFLKKRISARRKRQANLVSSGGGWLQFWIARPGETKCWATFTVNSKTERNVLALTTDTKNELLIAGDTTGFIFVFDISNFCTSPVKESPPPPHCVTSWPSHAAEILSIKYISHATGALLLSSGADCTVRLWTMEGHYIGTFGQKHTWNLADSSTFQYPKTPWGDIQEDLLHEESPSENNVTESNSKQETLVDDSPLPVINEGSETPTTKTCKSIHPKEESHTVTTEIPSLLVSVPSSQLYPSLISDDKLNDQHSERAQSRMERRLKRRQVFSGFNVKPAERFGLLCSPYQALPLQNTKDIDVPNSIADLLPTKY